MKICLPLALVFVSLLSPHIGHCQEARVEADETEADETEADETSHTDASLTAGR